MIWPFKHKPEPEPQPPAPDCRCWNEDWRVGDTAECIRGNWPMSDPWDPKVGQRFTVASWGEGIGNLGARAYFLRFVEIPGGYTCTSFRKVQPVASEAQSVAERIRTHPNPGPDRVREPAPAASPADEAGMGEGEEFSTREPDAPNKPSGDIR